MQKLEQNTALGSHQKIVTFAVGYHEMLQNPIRLYQSNFTNNRGQKCKVKSPLCPGMVKYAKQPNKGHGKRRQRVEELSNIW
jgi:hypothetical protein